VEAGSRPAMSRGGSEEPIDGRPRPVAMRTTRHPRILILAVGLLAVALCVAACTSGGSAPASAAASTPASAAPRTPPATAAGPLLTVETRGGLCAAGPCGTTVTLERDGRVHVAAKPPNDLGTVAPAALAALDAAIRAADFTPIRSHPFTGQCPTAVDGQEIVFEFGAPSGVERIATCETAVDFGSPLFRAVSMALGPFVPLPAP
jgi:hypothetical protein